MAAEVPVGVEGAVAEPGQGVTADLAAGVHAVAPVTARTPLAAVDRVCYAVSSAADHGLLWLALGSLRAARRGEPAIALKLGATLGLESLLTNGVVKLAFRRVRPPDHFAHDEPLPFGMRRPITSSFPSGHAATAFLAATLLARGTRAAPAYWALATLVAYSRVRVRMHHPADVVAGAALGLALGALARRLAPLDVPPSSELGP